MVKYLIVFLLIGQLFSKELRESHVIVKKITFGSCNKESKNQDYWQIISKQESDLWIWLGDNIYGDSHKRQVLENKYSKQFNNIFYKNFREKHPIIGIWDDHDYGKNNAHKEFEIKDESQIEFLKFFEEPKGSIRYRREGIYHSYVLGEKSQKIKFLMLDVRYHADEPGETSDILGEKQWAWFEEEIKDTSIKLWVIASGLQVLPMDHKYEKWANYPSSRNRLLKTLQKDHLKNVLILSGDRHHHEISKYIREGQNDLIEVTSSGLTHSSGFLKYEKNRYREGQLYAGKGYGLLKFNWHEGKEEVDISVNSFDEKAQLHTVMKLR